MQQKEIILILDFGSQYTQLIARRIRESKVYSEIHPHNFPLESIKILRPSGIILSGGPMSVNGDDSPQIDSEIFSLGIPILGICYGLQLIAKTFGGKVEQAEVREYGGAEIIINQNSKLLSSVSQKTTVWMSHGDHITAPPEGFEIDAKSGASPVCGLSSVKKNIYGVQFHPEVAHTAEGEKIIQNFLFNICRCKPDWTPENFIDRKVEEIRELVGGKFAICALSGGVDSSVAAILLNKAIGDKLICVHVDSGLMRLNESEKIVKMFDENYNLNITSVDASGRFLSKLKGVADPEIKRRIIGAEFISVFEEEANKYSEIEFLVQGTLYPDVIESVPVKGRSATIKTHHNVGGLPERMKFKLIEPFRELFKDEVRQIGRELGLPAEFIRRHPFPGPGLAVRILGEITDERLIILREADELYINELLQAGIYDDIWQAFAVLLPIQTVGVMGDSRTYENVVALRAVTSSDGMTADWFHFDANLLSEISNKIIRNVRGVNRVVYDISSKPPSTIEWE